MAPEEASEAEQAGAMPEPAAAELEPEASSPAQNQAELGSETSGSDAAAPEQAQKELTPEERARQNEHEEIKALLGPDVRTPVGIPKKYRPVDASTHELFRVALGEFEGPLDLLLYLIRQHELDIFDIPMAFITERYLETLQNMEELSIDVAGEFLVMAAELMHIKSKMLLPPAEGVPVEDDELDDSDPRTELVRRLLEYQKYRDAATDLGDRDQLGRDIFARIPPPGGTPEDFDPGLRDTSIFRLVEAMADVLSRHEPEVHHEISIDPINVSDQIDYIYDYSATHGQRFPFSGLFKSTVARRVLVITFLALLELVRLKAIRVEQDVVEAIPEPPSVPPPAMPESAPIETESAETEAKTDRSVSDEGSTDASENPEEPAPRKYRLAFELPPLETPRPAEIFIQIIGEKPQEASGFEAPPPEAPEAPPTDSVAPSETDLT